MIPYDDRLRETIRRNIDRHRRLEQTSDGLRRAAVAIVLIDSEPDDHFDPFPVSDNPLRGVPGDVSGLDGRVYGVSGGAAFLLAYGARSLRAAWRGGAVLRAGEGATSLGATLAVLAALTWLNPHVYLDTVVLLGAVSAKAGGAPLLAAIARVTFWGALAMALTAGVGALFGVAAG